MLYRTCPYSSCLPRPRQYSWSSRRCSSRSSWDYSDVHYGEIGWSLANKGEKKEAKGGDSEIVNKLQKRGRVSGRLSKGMIDIPSTKTSNQAPFHLDHHADVVFE